MVGLNRFVSAVLVLAALAAGGMMSSAQAAVPPEGRSRFAILKGDDRIGEHRLSFHTEGGALHVRIEIDIAVKLIGITLFRYEHRSHEVWRDGRLIALDTTTNDDGKRYKVTARATPVGMAVEATGADDAAGSYVAPLGILPTSYWNPETVRASQLLNTQTGALLSVKSTADGVSTIATGRNNITAQRHALNGDLRVDIWYAPSGEFVKLQFDTRGSKIDYVLEEGLPRLGTTAHRATGTTTAVE